MPQEGAGIGAEGSSGLLPGETAEVPVPEWQRRLGNHQVTTHTFSWQSALLFPFGEQKGTLLFLTSHKEINCKKEIYLIEYSCKRGE